ncbi:MAG: alpha-L-fucosidase [Acidobacteriota bacterium]
MKQKIVVLFLLAVFMVFGFSMADSREERYIPETNPAVIQKIKQWQDIKFGLLMHWGSYSQWGIVESWSLSPEEYGWCGRKAGSDPGNYFAYKKEYEALKNTFDPAKFDPDKWAAAAKDAGMKYVIFTTKHHDGFCMFDSGYTDYKVTSPDCPFSADPRSNITREIFDAFRNKGMWTGAYFSKPDWNSPYYWDPKYPPRDRNVNYEPEANPEKWNKFVEFTHNQILELLTDYGKIDILWLDGGWVAKAEKSEISDWTMRKLKRTENGYLKHRMVNQDIKMDELVKKAREKQADLIVVDRAVHGKNQNYLTPENRVPKKALPYPWESCIISGGGWSHTRNAKYKTGREGIQLLVDIVSKGGNLLLNIAPTPEGEWQKGAYDLLEEYAKWMKINSEGIYNSRVLEPFKEDNICMTRQDNGNAYFFYMCKKGEKTIPPEIYVKSHQPENGSIVTLLGYNKVLKWKLKEKGFKVFIPEKLRNNPPCDFVWTIKASRIK